ncbi:MAG: WD40/YVTN/BNR-like repeat-containing protein [Candidatus Dormibacteria bacterium]
MSPGRLPRWRLGAGALAMLLAAGLAGAAVLAQAASSTGPWAQLHPLQIPAARHASVWQMVGNPSSPENLVAATSQGVWTSNDDGKSWAESSLHQFTWALGYANSGSVLYAGTNKKGVFRSTDDGLSWTKQDAGLGNLDVRAIATGPSAIVLGTAQGVYVSGNGRAWESAGLGSSSISAVAIVANTPLGVVAGSDQTAQNDNLYRSLSVGVSPGWQQVPAGAPGGSPVFAIAAGPVVQGGTTPPILVGSLKGLYGSTDGGDTWHAETLAGGALWSVNAIAFDPDNPQVIYVGGDNGGSSGGGLQRSVNAGGTWAAFQQGIPAAFQDITALAALPTAPLTVLASTWDPDTRQGGTARALDTSAPGAVALSSSSGTPISVAVSPTPTGQPVRPHHHQRAAKPLTVPVGLLVGVVAIVVIILILVSIYLRRRRLRLDAEAPP